MQSYKVLLEGEKNPAITRMGQRNTLCTHQMLDLQLGQNANHFHPDHCTLSANVANYANRTMHPGVAASAVTAEQGVLFRDYPESSAFYGNQYNNFQNFHAVPNLGLTAAAPSNFYAPCMFASPSIGNFPPCINGSPEYLPSAVSMDEFGRSDQFIGFGKRKNAEVPPGNPHHINESASSSSSPAFLSLNCGSSQWEQSYEPVLNLPDSTNFEHPDYQESGNMQAAEGSQRSVRSRSSVVSLQPEHVYFPHPSYGLQAVHIGQPLHPASASNMWMGHFGTENIINDGTCLNWSYNHPMGYPQGRSLHSGAFELTNMGVRVSPDGSSNTSAAVLFNPNPLPSFHQHLSPAQTMQHQGYGHQVQMPIPSFQHPLNNLHPVDVNSSHGLHSGPRFPHIPSNSQQAFRPRHVHHIAPDFSRRSMNILSPEDAAIMGISGFYGVGNAIDQHQEMRLDIDQMSYEELLALEEQIGNVKTGLTEEHIIRNLKTSMRNSKPTFLLSDELSRCSSEEPEACIICQVEYEEDEMIGTLDCGHNYHGECIKRWLLEKNLCPICKKTGLATDNSEE